MPNPREAVFDVLKTKRDRAREAERGVSRLYSREEAFALWNDENARARAAAHHPRN